MEIKALLIIIMYRKSLASAVGVGKGDEDDSGALLNMISVDSERMELCWLPFGNFSAWLYQLPL